MSFLRPKISGLVGRVDVNIDDLYIDKDSEERNLRNVASDVTDVPAPLDEINADEHHGVRGFFHAIGEKLSGSKPPEDQTQMYAGETTKDRLDRIKQENEQLQRERLSGSQDTSRISQAAKNISSKLASGLETVKEGTQEKLEQAAEGGRNLAKSFAGEGLDEGMHDLISDTKKNTFIRPEDEPDYNKNRLFYYKPENVTNPYTTDLIPDQNIRETIEERNRRLQEAEIRDINYAQRNIETSLPHTKDLDKVVNKPKEGLSDVKDDIKETIKSGLEDMGAALNQGDQRIDKFEYDAEKDMALNVVPSTKKIYDIKNETLEAQKERADINRNILDENRRVLQSARGQFMNEAESLEHKLELEKRNLVSSFETIEKQKCMGDKTNYNEAFFVSHNKVEPFKSSAIDELRRATSSEKKASNIQSFPLKKVEPGFDESGVTLNKSSIDHDPHALASRVSSGDSSPHINNPTSSELTRNIIRTNNQSRTTTLSSSPSNDKDKLFDNHLDSTKGFKGGLSMSSSNASQARDADLLPSAAVAATAAAVLANNVKHREKEKEGILGGIFNKLRGSSSKNQQQQQGESNERQLSENVGKLSLSSHDHDYVNREPHRELYRERSRDHKHDLLDHDARVLSELSHSAEHVGALPSHPPGHHPLDPYEAYQKSVNTELIDTSIEPTQGGKARVSDLHGVVIPAPPNKSSQKIAFERENPSTLLDSNLQGKERLSIDPGNPNIKNNKTVPVSESYAPHRQQQESQMDQHVTLHDDTIHNKPTANRASSPDKDETPRVSFSPIPPVVSHFTKESRPNSANFLDQKDRTAPPIALPDDPQWYISHPISVNRSLKSAAEVQSPPRLSPPAIGVISSSEGDHAPATPDDDVGSPSKNPITHFEHLQQHDLLLQQREQFANANNNLMRGGASGPTNSNLIITNGTLLNVGSNLPDDDLSTLTNPPLSVDGSTIDDGLPPTSVTASIHKANLKNFGKNYVDSAAAMMKERNKKDDKNVLVFKCPCCNEALPSSLIEEIKLTSAISSSLSSAYLNNGTKGYKGASIDLPSKNIPSSGTSPANMNKQRNVGKTKNKDLTFET